jgi:polysaccharide export outer membrane protein
LDRGFFRRGDPRESLEKGAVRSMNHESKSGFIARNGVLTLVLACALLIATLCAAASAAGRGGDEQENGEDQVPEYVLGPGDTFSVRVWGYADLEQEVFIPPSGSAIVYPIGELKAAGLTASELDEFITKKLTKYLKQDPEVTVIPTTYVHSEVYVLGEVGAPGLYPFSGKMTVLAAVTRAGNPTPRAAIQQVSITRPDQTDPAKARIIIVDLDSVIHKGEASNDIDLRPGDIVYVPDVISAAQHGKDASPAANGGGQE